MSRPFWCAFLCLLGLSLSSSIYQVPSRKRKSTRIPPEKEKKVKNRNRKPARKKKKNLEKDVRCRPWPAWFAHSDVPIAQRIVALSFCHCKHAISLFLMNWWRPEVSAWASLVRFRFIRSPSALWPCAFVTANRRSSSRNNTTDKRLRIRKELTKEKEKVR